MMSKMPAIHAAVAEKAATFSAEILVLGAAETGRQRVDHERQDPDADQRAE